MDRKEENHLKRKTARLSIISNSFLIILKVISGIMSGSVSIISEAIHSALDLVASIIAFLAVRISDKPADEEHPFGHGKFENVSGVIESLLIFAAAVWIIYEAVEKLIHPGDPLNQKGLQVGIVVMFVSGIINFFVSRRLYKVAKETDSVALEADALHLKTDVYTSLGVSIGLLLIYLTSWYFLDPIIAIFVAGLIITEAYHMLKKSFNPLLDSKIPEEEFQKIQDSIKKSISSEYACKELRTRKSGQETIVEFTLMAPSDHTIAQADAEITQLKSAIKKVGKRMQTVIVIEAKTTGS
jgi:cation diffusion facilitator family transporter